MLTTPRATRIAGLTSPPAGFRYNLADAGDHGNDSKRAVAQFRIAGLQIGHQEGMDVAEFEPHQ
jgi:hypothetical protein